MAMGRVILPMMFSLILLSTPYLLMDAIAFLPETTGDTPVGSTMVPIDTAALLLGGARSILGWLVPVVAAGVGIGFVLVRRKF